MRAFFTTMSKVGPGQLDTAIATAADAAKVVGAHGGDVRLFYPLAAGEQVDTTLFTVEYDSVETMAAAFDELNRDPEVHRLRTLAASGGTQTSTSMSIEVPTAHAPGGGRGSVFEVHVVEVVPGRVEHALADAADVCDFVEANGAINARVVQLAYSGRSSGQLAMFWEHEDMAGNARLSAAWFGETGLKLQARSTGAHAPTTRLGSYLYNEVPL
jgi:hypothetical protein